MECVKHCKKKLYIPLSTFNQLICVPLIHDNEIVQLKTSCNLPSNLQANLNPIQAENIILPDKPSHSFHMNIPTYFMNKASGLDVAIYAMDL